MSLGTSGCKARPCKAWTGWEFPDLKRVDFCYNGTITGTTGASEENFLKPFAQRGFVRGHAPNTFFADRDEDPWKHMFKPGVKTSYRFSFHPAKGGAEFVIGETSYEDMLSEADFEKVVALPADEAAYLRRISSLDLPRVFDAGTKAPATCSDEDLTSREPLLAARPALVMINVDALANQGEKRRGIPLNYEPSSEESRGRFALGSLLSARRAFDERAAMRVVPAFRVTAYRAPSSDTGSSGIGFKGEVQVAIAVLDLTERRVLCRTTARATNSGSFKAPPEFDAFSANLLQNLEGAAVAALRAANPKLAPHPIPVSP